MEHRQGRYDELLDDDLEQRADYIPDDQLVQVTATGDFFNSIHEALTARGTKLIVGPRGCGKTHLMRYTWLQCRDDNKLPFAIYVSFNRYYRLEPLLKSRSNAIHLFHLWALARILEAMSDVLHQLAADSLLSSPTDDEIDEIVGFSGTQLAGLTRRLENGAALYTEDDELASSISIRSVINSIDEACDLLGRKRAIILLDDAALTLTPEYLYEFFDIVRALKTHRISPKASVYPGTTEYGPRFHADHEAETVSVWLSVENMNYSNVMESIAKQRFADFSDIPIEVTELLKFAAFGVPRAYLVMLRRYLREIGASSSSQRQSHTQRLFNTIVGEHIESRLSEYYSLALKMPRFETLLNRGGQLFTSMVELLRAANAELATTDERQLIIGIQKSDIKDSPMVERMLSLLTEAGLIFEHPTVSHGQNRIYRRYTPHLCAAIAQRAFPGKSLRQTMEFLQRRAAKHPIRRSLANVLSPDDLSTLRLDLPACAKCKVPRLNESQRFCHQCGSRLVDGSTFNQCMSLQLAEVPGLTKWTRERLASHKNLRTIGDLLSIQDPGTELRKMPRVGKARASRIIDLVSSFVDEFLS